MMDLMEQMLELESRMDVYEAELILRATIQNICDYRTVSSGIFTLNNKETFDKTLEIFFENCKNSIILLNELCMSYGIEQIYKGNLNSKEEINDFTIDFVISRIF